MTLSCAACMRPGHAHEIRAGKAWEGTLLLPVSGEEPLTFSALSSSFQAQRLPTSHGFPLFLSGRRFAQAWKGTLFHWALRNHLRHWKHDRHHKIPFSNLF